ncbi:hypothetical protein AYO20_07446 [Fonsecaea nubica]|uniref:C2H2-type domain-containing protein n=1 Tax=Fonsecaea nubica TaxID=856822 RepID=A0A178CVI9_9EURO|nr:hypothetical protein AYO20_07446 [Fonsecaea nubica]OAL33284.1 hypothetical protein AYO20_07446 [Fonsecaea nubica]
MAEEVNTSPVDTMDVASPEAASAEGPSSETALAASETGMSFQAMARPSVPETHSHLSANETPASNKAASTKIPAVSKTIMPTSAFPPPKTDKPRPHVCLTCMRSFARLEHLKRHERSHTKEKPFACPECTRCFARRDLLLRHQQKLHSSTTPSARPRSGRRESVAGVASGRVRKNSTTSNTTTMRPRANTVSHVDSATRTLSMMSESVGNFGRQPLSGGHSHHNSMSAISNIHAYQVRGVNGHQYAMNLPKLETVGLPSDISGGLRTAPPYGGFGAEFGNDFDSDQGNTINPHALHMTNLQGLGVDSSISHFHQMFPGMTASQAMADDDSNFDWMTLGFENQMSFTQANENAIDDSSPSAMSTGSPAPLNELNGESNMAAMQHASITAGSMWSTTLAAHVPLLNSPMSIEMLSNFNDVVNAPMGTVSPKSLLGQATAMDINLPTPPDFVSVDASAVHSNPQFTSYQLSFAGDGPGSTTSTTSMDSSLRQSSTTTTSTDLVSDHIRNVLIAGLSQNVGFGQRKYSQPAISSPLSPGSSTRTKGFNASTFPSTRDLQRYVSAYIKYFHPHLPFLHIPTLNFASPDYTTPIRLVSGHSQFGQASVAGGGSCLILAIAAIGALYEHEVPQSRELFECAKRLISSYLEERRKANLTKTQFGPRHSAEREDTPLWLVQAMLLNVIYGHNCGDKTAAELASNHCAALVSLARGAELAKPPQSYSGTSINANVQMGGMPNHGWGSMASELDDSDWLEWKIMEERKRTLYVVFILSSMLVTAYNHPPALTNSEIRLNLPCAEELWSAESAQTWRHLGGPGAETGALTFAASLTHLLMSAHRQRRRNSNVNSLGLTSEPELAPSTFGCLILINALHNYIWETRQRHLGRQWTASETEQMHAHIEPALTAWEAAWASNPKHSIERPNPFGDGPLSADCVPLLDLAYIRLFVNFGRSKEAFWQRDYDAMSEELAKGSEAVPSQDTGKTDQTTNPPSQKPESKNQEQMPTPVEEGVKLEAVEHENGRKSQPSRRERHLRKAAFYAADSLAMSDKLGLSFAEHTSRELPTQSAMCAFDCAQVLAEWIATVQERVGKYLGVIGRDEMNLVEVPGIILLEDEDRTLIQKIDEILTSAESKVETQGGFDLSDAREGGYGSRILTLTAYILGRDSVWPVFKLMARSLETQAGHIKERALASVSSS